MRSIVSFQIHNEREIRELNVIEVTRNIYRPPRHTLASDGVYVFTV